MIRDSFLYKSQELTAHFAVHYFCWLVWFGAQGYDILWWVCLFVCLSLCILVAHNTHTHTHTTVLLLVWNMSGSTRVSRYQKGKTKKVLTNLDLLEQEIVSGSGICWAICKSAPHPRQPRQHSTTRFFTGRMPFLMPNQQRQSTEGYW